MKAAMGGGKSGSDNGINNDIDNGGGKSGSDNGINNGIDNGGGKKRSDNGMGNGIDNGGGKSGSDNGINNGKRCGKHIKNPPAHRHGGCSPLIHFFITPKIKKMPVNIVIHPDSVVEINKLIYDEVRNARYRKDEGKL